MAHSPKEQTALASTTTSKIEVMWEASLYLAGPGIKLGISVQAYPGRGSAYSDAIFYLFGVTCDDQYLFGAHILTGGIPKRLLLRPKHKKNDCLSDLIYGFTATNH